MKRVRDFHSQSWDNPFFDRSLERPRLLILRSVGFVVASAAIIYVFAYSPLLRIGKVTVNGTVNIDPIMVKAAAAQTLAGYDYYVIPKDHYFELPTIGVKNYIMARFPDLLSVDVKKHFERLEVTVMERQPTYRLMIGDKSYLLDQEGKGLREAVKGEGNSLIALSNDSTIFEPGKVLVQPDWLQAVIDLHKYFATQVGIRDQLFKFDPLNDDLEIITVEGWYAVFDPHVDVPDQLKTLSSALAGKFNPAARKQLLYIDARFGDKIFYKANQ